MKRQAHVFCTQTHTHKKTHSYLHNEINASRLIHMHFILSLDMRLVDLARAINLAVHFRMHTNTLRQRPLNLSPANQMTGGQEATVAIQLFGTIKGWLEPKI